MGDESMSDYISREAALMLVCAYCSEHKRDGSPCDSRCLDYKNILEFPAADVREVKRGKWLSWDGTETVVKMIHGETSGSCKCSVCGEWLTASDEYAIIGKFCPNCGAMMEEQT